MEKPDAPSCARNREPILAGLRTHFAERTSVLEIGSGTGQHAVYFAAALPHLSWQTSDRAENLLGIGAWIAEAELPNTPAPIELDVAGLWPRMKFDAVFCANTLHIMSWTEVELMFHRLPEIMADDVCLAIYGALKYAGRHTSDSNAAFDALLKERGMRQGLRDFEAVNALAARAGLLLTADMDMPSNNRLLVWRTSR